MSKTITLKRPFTVNNVLISEVVLRRPVGADFFRLGEVRTWVRAAGGQALVDNDETIRGYAERLITKPDPLLAMSQMDVLDAKQVKDAIIDFFQEESPTTSA